MHHCEYHYCYTRPTVVYAFGKKPHVRAYVGILSNGGGSSMRRELCAKEEQVTAPTLRKYQSQYENYHQLLSWLQWETDEKESWHGIGCLWCELCVKDKQNTILQSLIG